VKLIKKTGKHLLICKFHPNLDILPRLTRHSTQFNNRAKAAMK